MSCQLSLLVLALLLLTEPSAGGIRRLKDGAPERGAFRRGLLWAKPDFSIYHRQDDLLRQVADIVKANPDSMKMEVFSAKDGTYGAELKVVTVEPGGFTQRRDKVRMLLDFGEHGREFISSELGLLLLRTLSEKDGVARVWGNGGSEAEAERGRKLQKLLDGTVLKILPMENEGGRRLVESGRLCERKNGRGVDPNRNWPLDWGKKEPDYDPNEEYPGTAPFSEPEVKMLHALASEFKPSVWLNVHSGMEAMFTPWDHKAEVPADARAALAILQSIHADVMGGTDCQVGSGGKTVGYLAHGTATDYMFEGLKVPMSYTWEIYGDFKAHFDDCFRMFNPLDEKGVQDVLQRWLKAIMRLVELMPSHPALANSTAWSTPAATAVAGATTATTVAGKQQQVVPAAVPVTAPTPTPVPIVSGAGSGSSGGAAVGAAKVAAAQKPAVAGGVEQQGKANGSGPSTSTSTSTDVHPQGGAHSIGAGVAGASGAAGNATAAESGGGKGSSAKKTASISGGSGGEGGETSAGGGGGGEKGTDSDPRVTVVASRLGWGSAWGGPLLNGLLGVAGLAVVGTLAYRCLTRVGAERRGTRSSGYQTV